MLSFSIFIFMTGLHNIDNAYNIRGLNSEYNLNLSDIMQSGNIYSYVEIYQLGNKQILIGLLCISISCFNIGLLLFK